MDEQETVARFVDEHDLETPPVYRLLDLVSEVGELSKDAVEATNYGTDPTSVSVNEDEIGDTLFALLALSESLDIDAEEALATALAKYETRLDETDTLASGE